MNFHIVETVFSDSTRILTRSKNISKDSGAFQLHADTLFVFMTFVFKEISSGLARVVLFGSPGMIKIML